MDTDGAVLLKVMCCNCRESKSRVHGTKCGCMTYTPGFAADHELHPCGHKC